MFNPAIDNVRELDKGRVRLTGTQNSRFDEHLRRPERRVLALERQPRVEDALALAVGYHEVGSPDKVY